MIPLLPAVAPTQHCNLCQPKPQILEMRRRLAVGFGVVSVTCDGRRVWEGDAEGVRVGMIEALAYGYAYGDHILDSSMRRRSLDHDWRITFEGPLSEHEYQRQGRRKWVLIRTGRGFA